LTFSLNANTNNFAIIPFFVALFAKTARLGNLKRQFKISFKRYKKRKKSKRKRLIKSFLLSLLWKKKLKVVVKKLLVFDKGFKSDRRITKLLKKNYKNFINKNKRTR